MGSNGTQAQMGPGPKWDPGPKLLQPQGGSIFVSILCNDLMTSSHVKECPNPFRRVLARNSICSICMTPKQHISQKMNCAWIGSRIDQITIYCRGSNRNFSANPTLCSTGPETQEQKRRKNKSPQLNQVGFAMLPMESVWNRAAQPHRQSHLCHWLRVVRAHPQNFNSTWYHNPGLGR